MFDKQRGSMKDGATVYVFDVDGVLCEIASPTIDERVIRLIGGLLEKGIYCAINTGRAYDRIGSEFIEQLNGNFPELMLDQLFISTEMGGEATTFSGKQPKSSRTRYALKPEQLEVFRRLWHENEPELDAMRFYDIKESMGTTVRSRGSDEARYREQKARFEALLHEAFVHEDVIISGTSESTDVYAPDAGKDAGADNIIKWLGRVSDIKHDRAVCFGDSHNDYEMARRFAEAGFTTTFVYTGVGLEVAQPHDAVKVVDTSLNYTNGTVEYLRVVLSA